MRMRFRNILIAVPLSVALTVCGGGGGTPTTPTPPPSPSGPTISSVTVVAPSAPARPSESAQFIANANFSNGTSQNVTSQATWVSSNGSVATVTPGGMVTALAAGEADIRATYQNVTGSARITVTASPLPPAPSTFTLAGRVSDQSNGASLSDVRVEIKDRGITATTDSGGRYTFNALSAGQYVLRASKSGFDLAEPAVGVSANTNFDFAMRRASAPPPPPPPLPNGICAASSIPAGAQCINNGTPPVTAVCNDGAFSCSQNRQGTCSTHAGVRCWVCPGVLCNGILSSVSAPVMTPTNFTPVPLTLKGR